MHHTLSNVLRLHSFKVWGLIHAMIFYRYIQQLREGVHNFFATFIEVLRDRPPGHDWELEPGVTCGDYLFGMLQVSFPSLFCPSFVQASIEWKIRNDNLYFKELMLFCKFIRWFLWLLLSYWMLMLFDFKICCVHIICYSNLF